MNNLSALADLLKRFTCLFVAFCFFIPGNGASIKAPL